LRVAADTMVLADFWDEATRVAIASARDVLLRARTGDCEPWIEQLVADLKDAGPAPPEHRSAPTTARSITAVPARTSPCGDEGYAR
jgi:hypothetical protein